MAFTPKTDAIAANGVNAVTLVAGVASGPAKQVKTVVVYNADTVSHKIIISFVHSGVGYQMFGVTIAAGDTLVQDVPIVCTDNNDLLQMKLGEAITTSQPVAVSTYASIG